MLDDSREVISTDLTLDEAALEQATISRRLLPRAQRWAVVGGAEVKRAVDTFEQAPVTRSGKVETRFFSEMAEAVRWLQGAICLVTGIASAGLALVAPL